VGVTLPLTLAFIALLAKPPHSSLLLTPSIAVVANAHVPEAFTLMPCARQWVTLPANATTSSFLCHAELKRLHHNRVRSYHLCTGNWSHAIFFFPVWSVASSLIVPCWVLEELQHWAAECAFLSPEHLRSGSVPPRPPWVPHRSRAAHHLLHRFPRPFVRASTVVSPLRHRAQGLSANRRLWPPSKAAATANTSAREPFGSMTPPPMPFTAPLVCCHRFPIIDPHRSRGLSLVSPFPPRCPQIISSHHCGALAAVPHQPHCRSSPESATRCRAPGSSYLPYFESALQAQARWAQ
jgi:hypothetical protein